MMAGAPGLTVRYGKVDRAYGMRLATTPVEDHAPVFDGQPYEVQRGRRLR